MESWQGGKMLFQDHFSTPLPYHALSWLHCRSDRPILTRRDMCTIHINYGYGDYWVEAVVSPDADA